MIRQFPAIWLLAAVVGLAACSSSDDDASLTDADTSTNGSMGESAGDDGNGTGETMPEPLVEPDGDECSVASQNAIVNAAMNDYYLYSDQVPDLDLSQFDGPESTVRALRVDPPDRFSSVQNAERQVAFFDQGITFGFGFMLNRADGDEERRFLQISGGSPMFDAGIRRGERLLSMNGFPINEIDNEQFGEIIGEPLTPTTIDFGIIDLEGNERTVSVTSAEYRIIAVPPATIIERDGVQYGYLQLTTFIETARDELDREFGRLIEAGVTELILDMRYNGGGRTSIAAKLAGQIGGDAVAGQVFEELRHNERYAFRNSRNDFPEEPLALGVPRVVILATDLTASSSELVINGLEPFIDVTVLGSTTVGKPFQSRGAPIGCEKLLNAMEVESVNAAGTSVAGGIEPDCAVVDDVTRDFGDPQEGMLAAALGFLQNGSCPTELAARSARTGGSAPIGDIDIRPIGLID